MSKIEEIKEMMDDCILIDNKYIGINYTNKGNKMDKMERVKSIMGVLTFITGILGTIGGVISDKYWLVVIAVLSTLKLAGVIAIPWFAGLKTVSAIGTGLWMLFGGSLLFLFGISVAGISAAIIGD